MKRIPWLTLVAALAVVGLTAANLAAGEAAAPAPAKKINVVLITGGHGFDEKGFLKVFEGYDDIVATRSDQKVGGEIFDDISNWNYDVMVLYNFNQKITEKQQENFLKLLDRGVGLLVLHHANGAYNNWPEFWKIAGVTYHFGPWEDSGVKMGQSGFKGGVKVKVHVQDPNHPITQGLSDFEITDETYCRTSVDPSVHALLTTEEPSSDKIIGWVKTYRKANVCYLQSGHDPTAYVNENYRTLVSRAVRWTAGRLPAAKPAAAAPAPRMILAAPAAAPAADAKVRIALVTGGHAYDEKPFMAVFEAMKDVAFTHVDLKDESELFEDTTNFPYDVIVLYNMSQKISEKRQKNFLALLEKGVGVVAMHHCLAAYQGWPEYEKIIGGKFYLKAEESAGVKHAPSTYKHDVDLKVHIEDAAHPITKGVSDFTIKDETYKGYSVDPKAHVILTTDEPTAEKAIGWTGSYGKARTCYLLLGHDKVSYANPSFQTLVRQAILWAAGK